MYRTTRQTNVALAGSLAGNMLACMPKTWHQWVMSRMMCSASGN